MRIHFDEELEMLNINMIKMGSLCEDVILKATKYLFEKDEAIFQEVHKTDEKIDVIEREIETLCLRLLLQQQPVAQDLRTISSALKMISDMERIGDQASDIVDISKYVDMRDVESKTHIKDMAHATITMVKNSVESFLKIDYKLAESVEKYDDKVDALFDNIKTELTNLICSNKQNSEFCLDLMMIAKYLERIGDHATNIAGWVRFSLTGKHK